MSVLPLKGYKSLKAYHAFNALMLGLKMLPAYLAEGSQEFFDRIEKMSPEDQKTMIVEAAKFVEIQQDELEAIICFCKDSNGVPYGKEQMNNMSLEDIQKCIVAVCVEISKIKIDFVTESEKKNLKISQ
jgi:hypothetical protein